MLLYSKYLWIMNKELGMNVAASPRSRAQVAAVLAFVISHTTFLDAHPSPAFALHPQPPLKKTRSRTSPSLKAVCSLIDQVFDEIRKGKAAFLDIFIVVLHRLRAVFTDLGCERVIFLRSDHEGVHALRIDRHV